MPHYRSEQPSGDPRQAEVLARWGVRRLHLVDRELFDAGLTRLNEADDPVPPDRSLMVGHLREGRDEELRRLLDDAVTIAGVGQEMHGGDDAWPHGVADDLYDLLQDVEDHDAREGLAYAAAGGSPEAGRTIISRMIEEHRDIRVRLADLARATDDYRAPDHACLVWRLLYILCLKVSRTLADRMRAEEEQLFGPMLRNRTEA